MNLLVAVWFNNMFCVQDNSGVLLQDEDYMITEDLKSGRVQILLYYSDQFVIMMSFVHVYSPTQGGWFPIQSS